MALDYKDVLDVYDTLHSGDETLPQFSTRMNELTGTDLYSAGLNDNLLKRGSARLDQLIEKTGIPEYGASIGRDVGSFVGDEAAGERVGRGLGRMTLNFAPLLIPGAGFGATMARLGGTAALTGAETYTATDSPAAGLLSGATAAALPSVANAAEQFAVKKLGGRLVEGPLADLEGNVVDRVKRYFPITTEQKVGGAVGGQVGAAGLFGVSGAGQELLAGETPSSPFTTENLLSLTLGQAPFALMHLGGRALGIGGKPPDTKLTADRLQNLVDLSQARIKLTEAKKELEDRPDVDKVPLVEQPADVRYETLRETRLLLARNRGEQIKIKNDRNLTEEQRVDQQNKLMQEDYELSRKLDIEQGLTTFGDRIAPDSPRQDLLGRQVWTNKDGTARAIQVSTDPSNPPELQGKVILYSTKDEPAPRFGIESMEGGGTQFEPGEFALRRGGKPVTAYPMGRYSLPDVQWRTVKTLDEWNSKYKKDDNGQPMLPIQDEPMTQEELSSYLHDLDKVSDKVDNASTTADLQTAVVDLNAVEHQNNLTPTNDASLKTGVDVLTKQGVAPDKAVKTVVKRRVARAARKIQAAQQRQVDVQTATDFVAQQIELAKTDPTTQEEVNNLTTLSGRLATKSSANADALLSGELYRMYQSWVNEGRTGGFAKFADDVWETARTGKGLVKDTPTLDEVSMAAKESPTTRTIVEEAATTAVNSNEGKATFDAWAKLHPDEATYEGDQNLFHELVGQVGKPKDLSPDELNDFVEYWADATGAPPQEVRDEVKAFLERPHVKQWTNELEDNLNQLREKNNTPVPNRIVRPAGNKFLFAMAPYDPVTNKLGGKHTLPKNSIVDEATFQKIGGVGKPLNSTEIGLYKLIAPEAFEGGKVNVAFLDKALQEKGPIVETKKLGVGEPPTLGPAEERVRLQEELGQVQHHLETLGYDASIHFDELRVETRDGKEVVSRDWFSPEDFDPQTQVWDTDLPLAHQDAIHRFGDVGNRILSDDYPQDATGRYHFIAPKEKSQMPGYVEGLVRLPHRTPINPPRTEESRREKGILYSGPHFGAEDQNVLAFFRGYEETMPNGEKAFHVIEVQSDWGQKVREGKEQLKRATVDINERVTETGEKGKWHYLAGEHEFRTLGTVEAKTKEEAVQKFTDKIAKTQREFGPSSHPLLDVYNNLALKAAVQHAKEIGATKLILSDAETAMMTEGHDRQDLVTRIHANEVVDRLKDVPDVETKQFIDDQGRSILQIRGERGTTEQTTVPHGIVDLITVMDAVGPERTLKLFPEARPRQEGGMRLNYDQKLPSAMEKLTGQRGEAVDLGVHKNGPSPVFTSLTGPERNIEVGKRSVTGRTYDISNVPGELTLTEPTRMPEPIKNEELWVPENQDQITTVNEMGIAQGGKGMLDFVMRSKNPILSALGQDLAKFVNSLERISGRVANVDLLGYIQHQGGGRYEVTISPALLELPTFEREFAIAHELVHGLSMTELDNPTNGAIVAQLDALRGRAAAALPPRMKEAFRDAINSGWYDRFANGQVEYGTLMPEGTAQQRNVLYGLLTSKEFVAQGLSENIFREYLKGIKSQGQTGFTGFVNLVKQLLGLGNKISGTAFEEFLSHTNQLLGRSDSVASFRNFSDRYFEGLGMNPVTVDRSTRRAMGLLGGHIDMFSPADVLLAVRAGAVGSRTPEWQQANRDVLRMFGQKGEDAQLTDSILSNVRHPTGSAGLLDLADSLMTGKIDPDILDTLPEPAFKFVSETLQDVQNIIGAVHEAVQEGNQGVLNIADPQVLRGVMGETLTGIESMMDQSRLHDEKVKMVQQLFQVPPDGFYDNIVRAPEIVPEWASGQDKKGWFDSVYRFLEPMGQMAKRIPEAAEALARGWQLNANVRKMASESLKAFGMDLTTMDLTENNIKNFKAALTEPRLVNAVNKWIFENQAAGKRTGETRVIDANDARIVDIIGKLSAKDRDIVEDIVNKHQISMQHMQEQILEKGLQIASTNGAIIAQRANGGKLKDAVTLSETLLRAFATDRSDPNKAALADAQIKSVQARMTPDGFLDLARFAESASNTWKLQREWFNANPAWSSAQRYGKYFVEFKKNGKSFLFGVDSKKEAETLAEGRPFKFTKNQTFDEDRPPVLGPDSVGVVNKMRELEQNQRDILQNTGAFTPDQIEEMKRYSPSEQFATLETYRGGVPGLTPPPRGLTKGASELPWLKNHFSWVTKTSNYWSRQLLRAQARAHLLDPEITQNEELRRNLQTHYDNILQPDTQFGRLAQRSVMTWFMGFNPASAMINGTQPFLTHVAELTAMSGKPLDSYRRVLSALKEIYSGGLTKGEWKDPEIAKMIHRASLDGELDYSMYDERAAAQETLHTNYKRILQGNQPQTTGQRLGTMAGNLSNWGMMMFRTVERINNMSALISSYRFYRESRPNLSPDEAYAKAVEFNHAVNFGGGRAQRPIGVFAGRGAFPRSVAMLATAMQSYNLGTTFQIARYIRAGLFRPAGLTPAEVYNARKALVQMGSTQIALAGVLGLPFASGMLAILNQAFPDLELNRKLREGMNDILGGDAENGSILADIAMTGAPSMLGWDMQSRLSMGNTVPGVSEINGFQPENLLGAPANLVSNFVRGGYKLASGDPHAIDSFMPSALKKFEQLLRSGGQVLDYRDRPIFTPTLGEKVGIALGFNPKRLSDYNAASRIARQADDNVKRREGQFHQQMAEEVLKGNFGSVRQAVIQRTRENEKYNPQEAIRAISTAAEALTFPRDLRREGTLAASDVRTKLLSTFNIPPTQVSEVDRLKFRQGIEQRLGLVTTSPTGLTTAAVMDQLRQQNPGASRVDLRRQAMLLLHGRHQQTLSLPAE